MISVATVVIMAQLQTVVKFIFKLLNIDAPIAIDTTINGLYVIWMCIENRFHLVADSFPLSCPVAQTSSCHQILYSTLHLSLPGVEGGDSSVGRLKFDPRFRRLLPTGWIGVNIIFPTETSLVSPPCLSVAASKIVRRQSWDPSAT